MGPILNPKVPLWAPPFQYHLRSQLGSSRCARWGLCCLPSFPPPIKDFGGAFLSCLLSILLCAGTNQSRLWKHCLLSLYQIKRHVLPLGSSWYLTVAWHGRRWSIVTLRTSNTRSSTRLILQSPISYIHLLFHRYGLSGPLDYILISFVKRSRHDRYIMT